MITLDDGGRHRRLRLVAPPPDLATAVEYFCAVPATGGTSARVVPDTSPHVVFVLRESSNGISAVCRLVGARSRYSDIDVHGRVLTIAARLTPGTLPLLLHDHAAILTDASVPVDLVWGRVGRELIERMGDAEPHRAMQVLAGVLRRRLTGGPIEQIRLRGVPTVAALSRATGLSPRGVYDRFSTQVGLPPKLALRIERLHTALAAANAGRPWAQTAAMAGYSDQAHLTREAVALLGESPAVWHARAADSFKTPPPALTQTRSL
jgi:AraC-like DNA-binding protein